MEATRQEQKEREKCLEMEDERRQRDLKRPLEVAKLLNHFIRTNTNTIR